MCVWAFFYHPVSLLPGGFSLAGLWDAFKQTLVLQHEFHFYYLHILILVYVFLPITRAFLRNASRRETEYFLLCWFVTGILFPLIQYFWPFRLVYTVGGWYKMGMGFSAIGYGALGYYLKRYGGGLPQPLFPAAYLGLNMAAAPSLLIIPLSALVVILFSHICWEILRNIPIVNKWLI